LFDFAIKGCVAEAQTAEIMRQVFSALEYLHKNRIVHRDVKLENLFISSGMIIKLGDFGLADFILSDTERMFEICGSDSYIAPEMLSGIGHRFEVDIWSAGVVMYGLLEGCLPFERKSRVEKFK
jgi:serine/threonine protein kinase